MSKASSHPVLPIRAAPEVHVLVEEMAAAEGVSRALMGEMLLNEALEARGKKPPTVNLKAKEARRAVMDFKRILGVQAEEALRDWLKGP